MTQLFKAYRYCLSPFLGCRCRFVPSCSEYAEEAFARHGSVKGMWLSALRVLRCNPFGGSGHDPVP